MRIGTATVQCAFHWLPVAGWRAMPLSLPVSGANLLEAASILGIWRWTWRARMERQNPISF
jgi:hypothetical protein